MSIPISASKTFIHISESSCAWPLYSIQGIKFVRLLNFVPSTTTCGISFSNRKASRRRQYGDKLGDHCHLSNMYSFSLSSVSVGCFGPTHQKTNYNSPLFILYIM
eukprot:Filipodium_phascolosomae@DN164_c0_g1_i1.p1